MRKKKYSHCLVICCCFALLLFCSFFCFVLFLEALQCVGTSKTLAVKARYQITGSADW